MQKIIHLDLKGAPLTVLYLEKVMLSAKSWGATGILLEWEDTFPYTGQLTCIGSVGGSSGDGMYTRDEVNQIINFAKSNNLEVIQLVQTIGHMEFVLKHEPFRELREAPRSSAVLCPSKQYSQHIVREMLVQALDAQPDANYFHIGADEVWHSGVCPECQKRAAASQYGKASLFLEHVRDLALFLKDQRPNLTILIWDDMLRNLDAATLKAYKLGELVQPVLWDYNTTKYFRISPRLWHVYRETFPKVWAASAFKGANGSSKIMPDVARYVSNHEAWRLEIKKYEASVNFAGIMLTGWSRYAHYATLCELMPVSLPSLASCLRALEDNNSGESWTSDALPAEEWPGGELAHHILFFTMLKDRCLAFLDGDQVGTWLNPWQVQRNYTAPVEAESVGAQAEKLLRDLSMCQNEISSHLLTVTGPRSADEWVGTNITPIAKRLAEIQDVAVVRSKLEPSIAPS